MQTNTLAGLLVQACFFTCAASNCQDESQQRCGHDLSDTAVLLQSQSSDILKQDMQLQRDFSAQSSVDSFREPAAAAAPSLQESTVADSSPNADVLSSPNVAVLSSPSFVSVPIGGCQCRAKVGPNDDSQGCCREGGESGWGTSQVFQLQNAIYDEGTLTVLGQRGLDNDIGRCFSKCKITWFGLPGRLDDTVTSEQKESLVLTSTDSLKIGKDLAGGNRSFPNGASLSQTTAKCDTGWQDLAVVVSREFETNLYHDILDSAFTAFVTASHFSLELGCPSRGVEVFTVTQRMSRFDELWAQLFGKPLKYLGHVTGCYKQVVYGTLMNQRWVHGPGWPYPNVVTKLFRSQALVPWALAFSANLRIALPDRAANTHSKYMVLVHHARLPPWIWDYKWEQLDIKEEGFAIQRQNMGQLSVKDQMRVISGADGIISATGAGFTHQVFLPTFSALYEIISASPEVCDALPETWHDAVALHMGHTSMHWRSCNGEEDFTRTDQISMLQTLRQRRAAARKKHESSACFIFASDLVSGDEPRCHKEFGMKLPPSPYQRCGRHFVGPPLLAQDEWSLDDVA